MIILLIMRVFNKFKALSRAKKFGVVIGTFILIAIATPTEQSSNPTIDSSGAEQSLRQVKAVDTTLQQPISTTETKTESTTEVIPFRSSQQNDSTIEQGRTVKSVTGVNGERTMTYEVNYTDGVETARREVSNVVTTPVVNEVTLIGTKQPYVAPRPVARPAAPAPSSSCDPNYSPCIRQSSSDLNCPDIGVMVRVIGRDVHRFDRDKDGYGCESYN